MVLHNHSYTAMIDVVESRGPVLLLRARGHINTQSAALFEANAMRTIADTNSHVVIEASEVTYLSSAGLRVFLRLWRELKKSDRVLSICNLRPYINQVFELLGFDRVITIHSDVDSALAATGGQPDSRSS